MKVIDVHPDIPHRATGKTFRILTKALLMSSQGNKVFIVVNNTREVDWTFRHLLNMAGSFLQLTKDSASYTLNFPNEGFIKVVPNDYRRTDFSDMVRGYNMNKLEILWDIYKG